ncbi:AAA family ATPase [Fenollaria massiliensis]|uniref:AAA family ATPase n=1 Tax=Fenollaria massiliensis TaxID=938288 RepID=UPI0003785E47|nr:AAA family ATPase [Fenollaria massiliensis]
MVKIKKIDLINFQSHKFTSLDFADGLNVIVGPSDNGKTSILRAIRWVFFNEPQGLGMLRNNEDFVSVRIYFNNDYSVERKRSKKENLYIIYNERTAEVQEFNSLRTGLPPEVSNVMKIKKITLDKASDINFNIQFQHDGPFMFSYTATQKSALIGKMYNLDVVDKAIDDTNKDIKSQKSDIKRINEEIKELDEKILIYKDIEKEEQLLKDRETLTKNIEESVEKLNLINSLKDRLDENKKNKDYLIEKINDFDKILSNEALIENISKSYEILNKYKSYQNKLALIKLDIDKTEAIYKKSKNITEKLDIDNTIIKNLNAFNKLNELKKRLNELNVSIEKGKYFIKENDDNLNKDLKEYTELLIKLKKCPYCNSDVDKAHIDLIVKEYL